jgi:hypothetical protein
MNSQMSLTIITTILAMHISMTAIPATSPQSSPSPSSADISALEKKALILDRKVEFWTRFSFWFVTLTACAAVGYGLGQRFQVVRSRQAAQAHADLSAAKDRANAETIERVRADASTESKRIESQAKKDIEAANKRSDEISAEARVEAARLTAQNLATETRLEAERKQRLELEKSFAFRQITKHSPDDIGELKKHAGTHVTIFFSPETEPMLLAGQLFDVLTKAGWKIDNISPFIGSLGVDMFTGLSVRHVSWEPPREQRPSFTTDRAGYEAWMKKQRDGMTGASQSSFAAGALRDFIELNGIAADKKPEWVAHSDDPNSPLNIVKVFIGNKVNTYLLPDEAKKMLEIQKKSDDDVRRIEKDVEQRQQEFEERMKHWDEDRQRAIEEYRRHIQEEQQKIPP